MYEDLNPAVRQSFREFDPIRLENEERRLQKKIAKRDIQRIKLKPPIVIQDLFPTRLIWKIRTAFYHMWFLIFFVIGLLIGISCVFGHINLIKLWSQLDHETNDDVPPNSIVLYCATVIPLYSGDVKEFIGIPYGSLPLENHYFYKPGPLLSFIDCYKAYWFSLEPHQKSFKDGRLTFYSVRPYRFCKQISKNKSHIIGKDYCLTINIKMPGKKNTANKKKLPVVILLTGRTYMENRPFPVGNSIIARSNAIFISINFRLSIFGFSNFYSMKSPHNIGVFDFIEAMKYIYKYIDKFDGNRSSITLFAEESGATTALIHMLMNKMENWFSKIWLIDGSAYISDPPARNLFYDLYSSPGILCNVFQESDDIFNCLQNQTTNNLLNHTPDGWLNVNEYFHYLPTLNEYRDSLLERIEHTILSPLESIMKVGSQIFDVPTVIMSKIDYMPYYEKLSSSQNLGNLTKSELYTKTRLGFLTYQTAVSQIVVHREINLAYDEYIKFVENRSIFNQHINEEINPLGFEAVLQAIISDLRVICPYSAIAKYLQVNAHIMLSPIYRIIDGGYRYTNLPTNAFLPCDLNYFLQDEISECKSAEDNIPHQYRETLLKSFINFIHKGVIEGTTKMEYPSNSLMKEFEETFVFVGRLGFRTPGVRETSMLRACNIWRKGSDEFPMLKTSAKVN